MNNNEENVFGLLAGAGSLPVEFIRHLEDNGISKVAVLGFAGHTEDEVKERADYYCEIGFGQLNKGLNFFTSHGVKELVFLGWMSPKLTISNLKMDFRMLALAAKTKDRRADNVIRTLIAEAAKEGITVVENPPYLKHLLIEEGVITKKKPDAKQMIDVEFGKEIALAIGGMDIGQTAIVNKHAVVAVEAMEGTDKCIRRAGEIIKNNVIVKMAKPEQDFRFDVPCFGPRTIKVMKESGASVIALEAGKTYILEREETLKLANKYKIVIMGITRD